MDENARPLSAEEIAAFGEMLDLLVSSEMPGFAKRQSSSNFLRPIPSHLLEPRQRARGTNGEILPTYQMLRNPKSVYEFEAFYVLSAPQLAVRTDLETLLLVQLGYMFNLCTAAFTKWLRLVISLRANLLCKLASTETVTRL